MKKFIRKTITATVMTVTALASVSSFASNYKPSIENQVGRMVDHNTGATKVNPDLYKSLSFAAGKMDTLAYARQYLSEEMGHIYIYGNNLKTIDEIYGVKVIHGNFHLHDNPIKTLRGTQLVERIGGNIHLHNMDLRDNLDGFVILEEVGGYFLIQPSAFHNKVVDFRGLGNLQVVRDHFSIRGVQVKSYEPFSSLVETGHFDASNTGMTTTEYFENYEKASSINFAGNNIEDLSGLRNVDIEGYILIDRMVLNNANLVKMPASSVMCQEDKKGHYHPNGISQEEACEII